MCLEWHDSTHAAKAVDRILSKATSSRVPTIHAPFISSWMLTQDKFMKSLDKNINSALQRRILDIIAGYKDIVRAVKG